jgi:predicted AlkP superfamily phosphohydrolase/phosphomutase
MIARGELPALSHIQENSACVRLDHGAARRTGLAFEHLSSGLSPQAGDRWSAVYFDKNSYKAWQEDVRFGPFTQYLESQVVIFDAPYFDMAKDPRVQGVVAWGAHDPGTAMTGQPAFLLNELMDKFGPYPAQEWIYGFAWPSTHKCRIMGESLASAVDLRSDITRWLFKERMPQWDLGIVVISELHSVIEGLWHGIDSQHPLYHLPSAKAAARGIEEVYRAVDRMLGRMLATFPDTTIVCFSMHGMGPNESDVSSMALLPELLFRKSFKRQMLEPKVEWRDAPDGVPVLGEQDTWRIPMNHIHPAQRLKHGFIDAVKPIIRMIISDERLGKSKAARIARLNWMPATHYQPYWKDMTAFALPAFYDGRIRINLMGRESHGIVPHERYTVFCNELTDFLMQCRNPRTKEPAIRSIERSVKINPLDLEASESDLVVEWSDVSLALEHPQLGTIGPLPYRRPGGHTGGHGIAYITGSDIKIAGSGVKSAFDLLPSVFDLLGEKIPGNLSGQSFIN